MKTLFRLLTFIVISGSAAWLPCEAIWGKADFAPAYVRLDILEFGKTVERANLAALRADASIFPIDDQGWVIKPTLLYGSNFREAQFFTATLGTGYYFPLITNLYIDPMIGVTYTYFQTKIDLPFISMFGLSEHFHSVSPYVGLELLYDISERCRVFASALYAWSYTKATVQFLGSAVSHPRGPSYAAMIEYDFAENWSSNLGIGYNLSLTKEKHGMRATGVKIGTSYWF